jgi:pimeloyl-ACP methyl ester carboxylesterase
MTCAPQTLSPHARQLQMTEADDRMRMLVIRSGFKWMSALAVCLASPFPSFRSKRRIGQALGPQQREVILIRGAALSIYPYWPGAGDLARHLKERGFAPTIVNHYEYRRVADEVARAVCMGRLAGGLSLVGYSFGSDAAGLLAELLDQRGIRVDTMVLIESTWGTPVPGNVDHCVNYYKSRALDFIPSSRGVPVVARSSRTQLANLDVGQHASFADIAQHSHFTIGDNHRLHRLVGDFLETRRAPEMTNDAASVMTNARSLGPIRSAA